MIKRCIMILCIILSLSGCEHYRNPCIKYYKVFPDNKQYQECFGPNYYCYDEEITEELFKKTFVDCKYISESYYYKEGDSYSFEIFLDICDQYDDLSKFSKVWLGDFDEEFQLESNDRYSIYCLCYSPTEISRPVYGLYGKLYYENFEIYYEVINYNCSFDSAKRHLDGLKEYFNQLYDLINNNRIEAGL